MINLKEMGKDSVRTKNILHELKTKNRGPSPQPSPSQNPDLEHLNDSKSMEESKNQTHGNIKGLIDGAIDTLQEPFPMGDTNMEQQMPQGATAPPLSII